MASAGGGAAGEGEWLKVAELRAAVQAQDPGAKVRDDEPLYFTAPASSSIDLFACLLACFCCVLVPASSRWCASLSSLYFLSLPDACQLHTGH